MRSQIILALLLAFAIYPSGGVATNIVTKKVILEIQPEMERLGSYFSDAANGVLTENGYTFLKQLRGSVLREMEFELSLLKMIFVLIY